MAAAALHRENIIQAAAKLFRKHGYSKTGLNDILAECKAPKGSLYYYFPRGKEQLGEEALRLASQRTVETLERLSKKHRTAATMLTAFGNQLAEWMEMSSFQDGCPMATTILETVPESESITAAATECFSSWRYVFEKMLLNDGALANDARRLANLAIAVLEGSLIQARVEQSRAPIIESIEEVASLMEARIKRVDGLRPSSPTFEQPQ